jgi:hypothetical protein
VTQVAREQVLCGAHRQRVAYARAGRFEDVDDRLAAATAAA